MRPSWTLKKNLPISINGILVWRVKKSAHKFEGFTEDTDHVKPVKTPWGGLDRDSTPCIELEPPWDFILFRRILRLGAAAFLPCPHSGVSVARRSILSAQNLSEQMKIEQRKMREFFQMTTHHNVLRNRNAVVNTRSATAITPRNLSYVHTMYYVYRMD